VAPATAGLERIGHGRGRHRRAFTGLVDEFGGLDAVINAGCRPSGFAEGDEARASVLSVHLTAT
jgi:hypothetical protein